mmetsp:Transcript_828/g.1312  ORF Transcript_828/g.1312 Transcript_828/m.1312 type:complete len:602 (-) Transcript_828:1481-3286(-)
MKPRRERKGNENVFRLILSHLIVAAIAFQMGFSFQMIFSESSGEFCPPAPLLIQHPPCSSNLTRSTNATTDINTNSDTDSNTFLKHDHPDPVRSSIFSKEEHVVGMSLVENIEDFRAMYNLGMIKAPAKDERSATILYTSKSSLPSPFSIAKQSNDTTDKDLERNKENMQLPRYTSAANATENCQAVKVILTDKDDDCLAILNGWKASAHIHIFARVGAGEPTKKSDNENTKMKYVHRYYNTLDVAHRWQSVPKDAPIQQGFDLYKDYILSFQKAKEELSPLAHKVAHAGNIESLNGKVIVMTVNLGYAEILENFVCAARSVGMDLTKVLVFATDKETYHLANETLGLTAYYNQEIFGSVPAETPEYFGDPTFARVMMAKVYCMHLTISLGYDILFLDADVTPHRPDMLEFFANNKMKEKDFDMYFQFDHNGAKEQQSYGFNSGLYYTRANKQTIYFFSVFVKMGDMVIHSRSHQQVMIALASEHASLYGLRVNVLDGAEGALFPNGWHYNIQPEFMEAVFSGDKNVYAFHMNWSEDYKTKVEAMQQIGDWYLKKDCRSSNSKSSNLTATQWAQKDCCLVKPIPVCHDPEFPSKALCEKKK